MDKSHEYSWMIGNLLGLNIIHPHPTIPDAGYCPKHGSYTRTPSNTKQLNQMMVEDECPYCKCGGD